MPGGHKTDHVIHQKGKPRLRGKVCFNKNKQLPRARYNMAMASFANLLTRSLSRWQRSCFTHVNRYYGTKQESKMWQQRPNKKPRLSIILTEDVHNLGVKGQIVQVRHGYGRNYLLPQGFAVYATPYNIKKYDAFKVKPGSSFKSEAEDLPSFLSDKVLTVYHDPDSKLAVFEQDISRAFRQELQIHVPLDCIELDEPIVDYDEHSVVVRLDENTTVRMAVVVRPKTKSEEVEKPAEPTAFLTNM